MRYRVRLSDYALESMVLASIEAYCLGDGNGRRHSLETLGYYWGVKRVDPELTSFHIERTSVSLSAQRHKDWVVANADAPRLKNEVVTRWSPHLTLLGDFHSHPYRNLSEVKENNGFEFSDDDFESFLDDDLIWEKSGNTPMMLVMTVARLERVRESSVEYLIRNNVSSFDVGEFRFWLNAAVGYLDADGERCNTGNTHSPVYLDLGSRFFNMKGDRIFEQ